MKQILLFLALVLTTAACNTAGNPQNKAETTLQAASELTILTPDELFNAPEKYEGQQITVKGLCVHTCKHSGKRMFLQGSNQEQLLLVTASPDIAKFENTLEGSNVLVSGNFSLIREAPEEHEHKSGEEACETESKSKNYQVECLTFAKAE